VAILRVLGGTRSFAPWLAALFLVCSLPMTSGVTIVSGTGFSFTLDICSAAPALDRACSFPLLAPSPKAGPTTALIEVGAVWETPAPQRSRASDPPDAPPPRLHV
jgi:hypothetical protein